MKFRFYIVLEGYDVYGTDNAEQARFYSESDIVLDTQTGQVTFADRTQAVTEAVRIDESDCEEEEEEDGDLNE